MEACLYQALGHSWTGQEPRRISSGRGGSEEWPFPPGYSHKRIGAPFSFQSGSKLTSSSLGEHLWECFAMSIAPEGWKPGWSPQREGHCGCFAVDLALPPLWGPKLGHLFSVAGNLQAADRGLGCHYCASKSRFKGVWGHVGNASSQGEPGGPGVGVMGEIRAVSAAQLRTLVPLPGPVDLAWSCLPRSEEQTLLVLPSDLGSGLEHLSRCPLSFPWREQRQGRCLCMCTWEHAPALSG